MDTIFAQATAPGRAGVAIVRISGPEAVSVLTAFGAKPVHPRVASVREISWDGEFLDECIAIHFPKGASFTDEDVLELQLHGSIALVKRVLSCLALIPGFRPADAGEFTKRALMNGRLDLTQVEGLADLIDAETEMQRLQASKSFKGEFSKKVLKWRQALLRAAALLEATIDFADEDVPVDVVPEVKELLSPLTSEFARESAGAGFAERVRDGFEVAIVGAPNVGKSTLLNHLARRDVAITSEIAGTTRDVVEVHMEISCYPVTILDTAGLRVSDDLVESMGIERAIKRAENADIRIFLGENDGQVSFRDGDIRLSPKADVEESQGSLGISGKTGLGVDVLVKHIGHVLSSRSPKGTSATRQRHEIALNRSKIMLSSVLDNLDDDVLLLELISEDLRHVIRELDVLIGKIGVEDLLGEIFSSFCIGK